jgi:predicted kinase
LSLILSTRLSSSRSIACKLREAWKEVPSRRSLKILREATNLQAIDLEEDNLVESINDKNLFKAVIMVGGPGSGKTYIYKNTFPGIKSINSDDLFEYLLEKEGLDKVIDSNAPDYEKKMKIRNFAKKLTKNKESLLLNGMIPIILDGTGKDYDKVVNQKNALERLGYDISMVFVNTNLETAKARNLKRERSVPEEVLENAWNAVQNNIGKFQDLFSGKFFVVDNSGNSSLDSKRLDSIHRKTIESPLKNKIGQQTINKLREIGGKYLSDIAIHKVKSKEADDSLSTPEQDQQV